MATSPEIDRELAALRKEIYEARSLIIKTDNLLKTLHSDLKAVGARQVTAERKHFIGHVAAYVVFGVIMAGGAYLYATGAVEGERAAIRELQSEAIAARENARVAMKEAERTQTAFELASEDAMAIYQSLHSSDASERAEGMAQLGRINRSNWSPLASVVLAAREDQLREGLARSAYERGSAQYRKQNMKEAVESLSTFMRYAAALPAQWDPEARSQAAYYLGVALHQQAKFDGSIRALEEFLRRGRGGRRTRSYTHLLLGDSFERTGKKKAALGAFEKGLALDPSGKSSDMLRRRIGKLGGKVPPRPETADPEGTTTPPASPSGTSSAPL